MLYLYAIKKRIIIYLMMSLFLSAAGCRLSIKNTLLVPDGECSKENAEKIVENICQELRIFNPLVSNIVVESKTD